MNIYGTSSNDILTGGEGNEILRGGYGEDTIGGGEGKNTLEGAYGNDVLLGVNEYGTKDVLTGGTGNDVFILSEGSSGLRGDNHIQVTDYNVGDHIDFGSLEVTDVDELYDTHLEGISTTGEKTELCFIYDSNNTLFALITGSIEYFLPPPGYR